MISRVLLLFAVFASLPNALALADTGFGQFTYFNPNHHAALTNCPEFQGGIYCANCLGNNIPAPIIAAGHNQRMICKGNSCIGSCLGCDGPCNNALIPVPTALGGTEGEYFFVLFSPELSWAAMATCITQIGQVRCSVDGVDYPGWFRYDGGISVGSLPEPDWNYVDYTQVSRDDFWDQMVSSLDDEGFIIDPNDGAVAWYQRFLIGYYLRNYNIATSANMPLSPLVGNPDPEYWRGVEWLSLKWYITRFTPSSPTDVGYPSNDFSSAEEVALLQLWGATASQLGDAAYSTSRSSTWGHLKRLYSDPK